MRGLYVITKATERSSTQIFNKTSEAILGGASLVQFRLKTDDHGLKIALGTAVAEACRNHGSFFLVNDSVDLALTLRADGVHIGQTDGSLIHARDVLGPRSFIGRTCHSSPALMNEAIGDGASYCAFGRLFKSTTKKDSPRLTLDTLKTIAPICSVPVVAIGGITADNAKQVIEAGADIIAVSSAVFDATNIAEAAHQLTQLI